MFKIWPLIARTRGEAKWPRAGPREAAFGFRNGRFITFIRVANLLGATVVRESERRPGVAGS